MQSIRQVARLNEVELEKVVPSNASWHTDYRDTAYIHIGGLPFELSEGDVLTLFSQYGNPVHINLVRDKETGKSKGFAFLKYEDQRSCDLAVDNMGGAGVMGRVLSVDHARYTKKEGEVEGLGEEEGGAGDDTDDEGAKRRKRRRTESGSEDEVKRPLITEELELAKLRRDMDDEDPMKAYMIKEKQAEVDEALKAVVKSKGKDRRDGEEKHRRRHHRSRRESSDEGGDDRRAGHKSRRHRANDVDDDRKRQSNREIQRERTATPGSDEDTARRRRRSRRESSPEDQDVDDRQMKRRSEHGRPERDRSDTDRSRSREPYRRR